MNRRSVLKALAGTPLIGAVSLIRAEELKPTDVIAVQLNGRVELETIQRLADALKVVWPAHKVVVFDESVKLAIVANGLQRRQIREFLKRDVDDAMSKA